ncbi:MAG: chemotaxis protein CheX [Planctomycetes bacterium]|nr:chemotaxis protein CheX [Planctomycetota bacterium]
MSSNDNISRAVSQVMETSAFMMAMPCDAEDLDTPEASLISVDVEVAGDKPGKVFVVAPLAFARELAANVLGVDEDDDDIERRVGDAFRELCNVITGQIVTTLFGESATVSLSPPKSAMHDAAAWEELCTSEENFAFDVEDYPVVLHFDFQAGA